MRIEVLVHPFFASLYPPREEFWSAIAGNAAAVPAALVDITAGDAEGADVARRAATIADFYQLQLSSIAGRAGLLFLLTAPPTSMTDEGREAEESIVAEGASGVAAEAIIDYLNRRYLEFLQLARRQPGVIESGELPDSVGALLAELPGVSLEDEVSVWGETLEHCILVAVRSLRTAGFRSVKVDSARCPS